MACYLTYFLLIINLFLLPVLKAFRHVVSEMQTWPRAICTMDVKTVYMKYHFIWKMYIVYVQACTQMQYTSQITVQTKRSFHSACNVSTGFESLFSSLLANLLTFSPELTGLPLLVVVVVLEGKTCCMSIGTYSSSSKLMERAVMYACWHSIIDK